MKSKLNSICFKFIGPLGRCLFSASKIPGLQVWKTVGVVCEGLIVSGLFLKKLCDCFFKVPKISPKLVCLTGSEYTVFSLPFPWDGTLIPADSGVTQPLGIVSPLVHSGGPGWLHSCF